MTVQSILHTPTRAAAHALRVAFMAGADESFISRPSKSSSTSSERIPKGEWDIVKRPRTKKSSLKRGRKKWEFFTQNIVTPKPRVVITPSPPMKLIRAQRISDSRSREPRFSAPLSAMPSVNIYRMERASRFFEPEDNLDDWDADFDFE